MRRALDSPATKIMALVVALAALATIVYELVKPADEKTAVAYFPAAVHLYPGSDVVVLGCAGMTASTHVWRARVP